MVACCQLLVLKVSLLGLVLAATIDENGVGGQICVKASRLGLLIPAIPGKIMSLFMNIIPCHDRSV